MSKYYGKIGFGITKETSPGVWDTEIIERPLYGDVLRYTLRNSPSGYVNDNITINNQISVLADPYAFENFQFIKYAEYMNARWNVESIEVQYPRLILNLGGVYNGRTPETT